jgi:hypothetical protein
VAELSEATVLEEKPTAAEIHKRTGLCWRILRGLCGVLGISIIVLTALYFCFHAEAQLVLMRVRFICLVPLSLFGHCFSHDQMLERVPIPQDLPCSAEALR